MIGIVVAMGNELKGYLDIMEVEKLEKIGAVEYRQGKICGKDVVLAMAGVGKVNAAICAQTMIIKYAPEAIINTGVAGSLSKDLQILDIAVSTSLVEHDLDTTAMGDPIGLIPAINETYINADMGIASGIIAAANELGIHAVPARIATGDQFISAHEKKQWIIDNFAAQVCEMEGAAVAQTCALSGVPFCVLRAISDGTDDSHHMEFVEFVDKAAKNSIDVMVKYLSMLK